MYSLNGTGIHTFAAACAFFVINRSMKILDLDRARRTLFLADLTADAPVFAAQLRCLAVCRRGT